LSKIFARGGWAVKGASTVAEGVVLVVEDPAPHWLILDLMLPDGDGADILRLIRDKDLDVRVAVTTGMSDSARLDLVRALAPDLLIAKPINLGELLKNLAVDND
jgi:DNA-binding response OmpR family regulator